MRIRLNQAGLNELLRSPRGGVFKEVASRSRQVENRAKQKVGVGTGRLRSSISHTVRVDGNKVVGRIGSLVDYARYHHDGTGIYGPHKRPIRPVKGKFLVFTPRGASGPVFAREVAGSPPNPYLVSSLEEVVPWPVRIRS